MPSVADSILAAHKVALDALTLGVTTYIRDTALIVKGDTYPLIVIANLKVSQEPFTSEVGSKYYRTYSIITRYCVPKDTIKDDSTIQANVEAIRNMYYGAADLVVSGVVIEDIILGDVDLPTRKLYKLGLEDTMFVHDVTTIE